MQSKEHVYTKLYDAIVFDDDEDAALVIVKNAVEKDIININETDEEGTSLLQHARDNCMEKLEEFLLNNGAIDA